jgi:hypothetical protein
LAFQLEAGLLVIRASTPDRVSGVTQSVDLLRADATAELIAVRALETLRAALIQFARRA